MVNDSDLIGQLQQGSLDALGILYDRHQRMVYRTALAITGDTDAAADLLQDVFLRLHRFASHIDSSRPLEPWLYRMTANLAYTWVKRSSRWLRPLQEMTDWILGARKYDSQTVPEIDEQLHQLQQIITSLPVHQRIVVVLYYLNDLSLQEIAEILDVPLGTVKSRLHYGREAVRKQLAMIEGDWHSDLQYEFT
jgi:RNA polymerase sigma-70 factor (ECF subfamily)